MRVINIYIINDIYKIIIVVVIYFGSIFWLFDSFGAAFLVSMLATYFFVENGVIPITISPIVFFGIYWWTDEIWLAMFLAGIAALLLSKNIAKKMGNGGGFNGGGGYSGGDGYSSGCGGGI